jgi:hypothetical protein
MKLLDSTIGTFLGPPFDSTAATYLKGWSEEGTETGIEEPHMLLAQHSVYAVAVWSFGHTGFVTVVVTRPVSMDAQRWVPSPSDAPVAATRALQV